MNWIKTAFRLVAVVAVSLIAFDAFAYVFFADFAKKLFDHYAGGKACTSFGRNYPQHHFQRHPERGFDIAAGVRSVACGQPLEAHPYDVWGNAFGCFDTEKDSQSSFISI